MVFPSSLVSLDLSENHFHPGAVRNLLLQACVNLKELVISRNRNMEDVQVLVDVVNTFCPNIAELTVDDTLRERVTGEHNFICWFHY